mgnify:CR=1 FL=1
MGAIKTEDLQGKDNAKESILIKYWKTLNKIGKKPNIEKNIKKRLLFLIKNKE